MKKDELDANANKFLFGDEKKNESQRHPHTELDLEYMKTEPAWGREYTPELYEALVAHGAIRYVFDDATGEVKKVIDKKPLWGILSYYTRDMRLGNLSTFDGEYRYCVDWLVFAGDLLKEGYVESFFAALDRVITILELSQSKGGFVRKRGNTFTKEEINTPPAKKGLLGGNRGDGQ